MTPQITQNVPGAPALEEVVQDLHSPEKPEIFEQGGGRTLASWDTVDVTAALQSTAPTRKKRSQLPGPGDANSHILQGNWLMTKTESTVSDTSAALAPVSPTCNMKTPTTQSMAKRIHTVLACGESAKTLTFLTSEAPLITSTERLPDLTSSPDTTWSTRPATTVSSQTIRRSVLDLAEVVVEYAAGDTPDFVFEATRHGRLLAVCKADGGVQPITTTATLRRLAFKATLRLGNDQAASSMGQYQFAMGVRSAMEKLTRSLTPRATLMSSVCERCGVSYGQHRRTRTTWNCRTPMPGAESSRYSCATHRSPTASSWPRQVPGPQLHVRSVFICLSLHFSSSLPAGAPRKGRKTAHSLGGNRRRGSSCAEPALSVRGAGEEGRGGGREGGKKSTSPGVGLETAGAKLLTAKETLREVQEELAAHASACPRASQHPVSSPTNSSPHLHV